MTLQSALDVWPGRTHPSSIHLTFSRLQSYSGHMQVSLFMCTNTLPITQDVACWEKRDCVLRSVTVTWDATYAVDPLSKPMTECILCQYRRVLLREFPSKLFLAETYLEEMFKKTASGWLVYESSNQQQMGPTYTRSQQEYHISTSRS